MNNRAAADNSFAAGFRAKADHAGTFVWADSTDADFASTANKQFVIRASGGVGVGTAAPKTTLDVAGVARVNGTTWPSAGKGMELAYSPDFNRGYIQVYDRGAPGGWGKLYLGEGNVGIGTGDPGSKLTVVGTIESTSGGVKFPDGTMQTTATVQGPTGPQGPSGPRGPSGPLGPTGPAVHTSAICQGGGQVPPVGFCGTNICTGTVVAEVRTAVQCSVTSDAGSCSSPAQSNGICCVCAP